MASVRNLILVLGDQLTPTLSSLAAGDPARDRVLMAELHDEASYVRHHKKKIAFLFSAMRHFAKELRALGWTVDYVKLGAPTNRGSFSGQLADAIAEHRPERLLVTEAGEWRVSQMMEGWQAQFSIPIDILPDGNDRAAKLVAHHGLHEPECARRVLGFVLVHVGSADAAVRHAQPHFASSGPVVRQVDDRHRA